MARLVVTFFIQPICFLIIGDTLFFRSSRKAPVCIVHLLYVGIAFLMEIA